MNDDDGPSQHDTDLEGGSTEPAADLDPGPDPDPDPGADPAPDPDGHGQLSYDCASWATQSRSMLASLLQSSDIAHAWQGTTLTVRERDEDAVDDLVDEVLDAAGPVLDPDAPKLVYEVAAWPVSLLSDLAEALAVDDIAYEWDHQGDLVVLESDEDAVTAVLEELPDPDESAESSDDGVAVHEVLDGVFVAADRLARNGGDAAGTVALVDGAERLARLALPFGFEAAQWRNLVGQVGELSSLITDRSDDGGSDATDGQIADAARLLRELLRQYV